MKRIILTTILSIAFAAVLSAETPASGGLNREFSVMSLSIREATPDQYLEVNNFDNRFPAVSACLSANSPSVLLIQHAEWQQVEALDKILPDYTRVSSANIPDKPFESVYTAIYFKTAEFSKEREGHFWLSETPEECSRGWNGCLMPRDATWAVLKDVAANREFLVVNVVTERAAKCLRHSLPLIQNRVYDICEYKMPVIVGGVIWAKPYDDLLKNMRRDYYDACTKCKTKDSLDTFNDFGSNASNNLIADHIFYRGFNGISYKTVTDKYAGVKYMSDHYPILTVFEFQL